MKKNLILLIASLVLLSCQQEPRTTYTITFDCQNCKVYGDDDKEITSSVVSVVKTSGVLYQKFRFSGDGNLYKAPSESLLSVKKTVTGETIEYEYHDGELIVPIIDNLTVTSHGSKKTLEECTWEQINELSTTGRAKEFFDIYDPSKPELNCKKVQLKGQNFCHTVRIIDFDHDNLVDESGKKAGITFEFANVITANNKKDAYTSIWDTANNFDYRDSVLNNFLNDETEGTNSVINMLPDDLSKIIKPVDKKIAVSTNEGASYEVTSFNNTTHPYPKLFPLAYNEMLDPDPDLAAPGEGDLYRYYKGHSGMEKSDDAYRLKHIVGDLNGVSYWLRSPMISEYTDTALSGDPYLLYVYSNIGVAPAFCI